MSGISGLPTLPMRTLSADFLKRVSGPATARNIARTLMTDNQNKGKADKTEQAAASFNKTSGAALSGLFSSAAYTPESANAAAAKGTPTHGFLFHDIDSMVKTAADPESKADASFVKDTLDFFTGGNYKDSDVEKLQGQMTTALKEAAQQIADTGRLDTSKLKSRMTVGDAEVSLAQLAEFQTAGRQLTPAFDGISAENTRFQDMQATANMAVARCLGEKFGQNRGEIGAMFSGAMNRLYEQGMNKIDALYTDAPDPALASAASKDSAGLRGQVADMFQNLDTSNKSAMGKDFGQKLNTMSAMMTQRDRQFGIPPGASTANMAAKNMSMYFSVLSRMI